MTQFYVYLEKALGIFFSRTDLLDETDGLPSVTRNNEIIALKKQKLRNNKIFTYRDVNDNFCFQFMIDKIEYELLFLTKYNKSLKVDNLFRTIIEKNTDPGLANRYGIAFYPTNIPGMKYNSIKLSKKDSDRLFQIMRICAKSMNRRNFYFDGATTDKEEILLKKIKNFNEEMKANKVNSKKDFYEKFLIFTKKNNLMIKKTDLIKIKNFLKEKIVFNFDRFLKKIIYILNDIFKLSFNTRERYFTSLLKKQNINFKISKINPGLIMFNLK